jgi:archaeal cell division control protein 6
MDEDEFRKQFMKKSVFKKRNSLESSYIPEKLYGCDETIKSLIFNYRPILDDIKQSSVNCVLLGKGGIGKTLIANFFGNVFKTIALEKDINLFVEYINCIIFRSLREIIKELLSKYVHKSIRGLSKAEALKIILTELIKREGYMLLIIDEVSMLKSEEVFELLNIAETFNYQKNDPLSAKLSFLLVSREREWMRIEYERILSRLNQKIKLKPYNYEEIFQILQNRASLAFKENVITNDLLEMVSQIVNEHKNVYHGIEILRKSGLMADKEGKDRIMADMIRKASNEVYPTFRVDIIDRLQDQELLVLYGLTASLLHKDEAFTIVDEAYDEYQTICETYGIEPHVKMSFRKYARTLNELKIITSKKVRIEDADRGRRLEITLLDIPAEKLEEILIDIFDKKFG